MFSHFGFAPDLMGDSFSGEEPMAKRKVGRNEGNTEVRARALHALAKMRRDKLSLAEACRLEHLKPSTLLRHVGSAVRQDRPGGRYRATAGDRLRRDLQVPTALGPTSVPIYGSKKAREISNYLNAIALYLRKGDTSKLERFRGKQFVLADRNWNSSPIRQLSRPSRWQALSSSINCMRHSRERCERPKPNPHGASQSPSNEQARHELSDVSLLRMFGNCPTEKSYQEVPGSASPSRRIPRLKLHRSAMPQLPLFGD